MRLGALEGRSGANSGRHVEIRLQWGGGEGAEGRDERPPEEGHPGPGRRHREEVSLPGLVEQNNFLYVALLSSAEF